MTKRHGGALFGACKRCRLPMPQSSGAKYAMRLFQRVKRRRQLLRNPDTRIKAEMTRVHTKAREAGLTRSVKQAVS